MNMNQIVIIGGGASGLVAAIGAARKGANVVIVDKRDRIGRKILATGNGRCNMTNVNCHGQNYYESDPLFISKVLKNFSVEETINFFEELGILHKVESEGRVYPFSDQAASVLDVLRMEIDKLKIEVVYNKPVIKIEKTVKGFKLFLGKETVLEAAEIIMACGGKAGPQFGCHGDGFKLAQSLGHKVVTPHPALVQVLSNEWYNKRVKGIRVKGCVKLQCDNEIMATQKGEIQFTEDGLSGICIFDLSREVNGCIKKNKKCSILIDLFPEYTHNDLIKRIQGRLSYSNSKTIEELLIGMINKGLIPVVLKLSDIKETRENCSKLTPQQINGLVHTLKEWKVPVLGTRSWEHAQVTAGGISTDEIDADTMESLKVPGLFFAGEIIDVDGICGGYNLQWAWSTGYIAGENAAKELKIKN